MSNELNGVNVGEMFQTIDAIKANPAIAKFHFRLKNEWLDGSRNRSAINEYSGAEQDLDRPQAFLLEADEPAVLLGTDRFPNPAEYLLQALAACVTTSLVYHAAARGIKIEEVESELEGDIDLRGFLGIDDSVRTGFQNIRIKLAIRADVGEDDMAILAGLGSRFSPIFDSVSKGVPIAIQTDRMDVKQLSNAA